MGEAVRRSRTRAVKQARVQNWLQVCRCSARNPLNILFQLCICDYYDMI
jgi:hypothetical protein